ncbi:3-Beta-hydroxysteroid-delta(8), delta(7)-isomerase, partial [Paramuricea clavata]
MENFKSILDYFLVDMADPINLTPVGLLLLCFIWSGLPRGPEKYIAIWTLFNACFIHIWMEGIVGVLGRGPRWMVIEYSKLDARYAEKDPTVMTIVCAEVFIMGPLCILWYNAIMKRLWYKPFLAIVTSTIQLFGAVIYVFTEVFLGFKNLPKLHSWPPSFTVWDDVFYFWIVFVFGNM